jgi:Flp pilus assembly pilin Flp
MLSPGGQPMGKLLAEFWRDDRGCVPMMEWMLVASILTLGVIAAQLAVRTP